MPTVEAIRKITIQASTQGVPQSTSDLNNLSAAQNRVALSANQLQISMASAQKLIDDNVQKLQQLKSANDNVGSSYLDLISKARDVSGSFSETVENILNTINHLKLLAVAAYAMSPALRSIVNADVAKALGLIPPVALAAGKSFLSFAAPALSFFGRIAVPIGAAVLAWQGLNYTMSLGSDLLDKYGSSERSLFGVNVGKNLDSLTKLQGSPGDTTTLAQQQYATELATRLAAAKQEISDMMGIQFNLTDAALKFQAVWVAIAAAMGSAAAWVNSVSITLAHIGSSPVFKALLSVGHALGNFQLPGTLQIAPPGTVPPPSADAAQELAVARGRLASGLDIAASNRSAIGKYGFRTFPGMFSDDQSALAGDNTPTAKAGPNDYDRQIESLKNEISQLNLEADGAGKASQAVQELKTAHDLNDAAMKANIRVTQQMRDKWKSYADTIADLNIRIKEQKALQDEQFKGATMFLSPAQSAAAGVAHGIDPNNWQAHLDDPAAKQAAFNEELKQSSSLATTFADSFGQAMVRGSTATQAFMSVLQNLESQLLSLATKGLINQLFYGATAPSDNPTGGLFGMFASWFTPKSNPGTTGNDIGSALGNVFRNGSYVPFALGGLPDIVSRPTLFPMANGGTGLAGEAGDEAILPLQRTSDGRLGVSGGGSPVNIVVNNNHSTAGVDVQQQQRPGGGVDIYAVITDTMNKHLASGGADSIMRGRYGAQIRARPR